MILRLADRFDSSPNRPQVGREDVRGDRCREGQVPVTGPRGIIRYQVPQAGSLACFGLMHAHSCIAAAGGPWFANAEWPVAPNRHGHDTIMITIISPPALHFGVALGGMSLLRSPKVHCLGMSPRHNPTLCSRLEEEEEEEEEEKEKRDGGVAGADNNEE